MGKTPEQKYHEKVAKIRSQHSLPDKALVTPGYGSWAAYWDGVIIAKMGIGMKVQALLLHEIEEIKFRPRNALQNGTLRLKHPGGLTQSIQIAFGKDEEQAITHLKNVLEAEKQRGVTGELPAEYRAVAKNEPSAEEIAQAQANHVPMFGISDEKFRAKYKIPADAILARGAGVGYISFDGHFVTIQHIGMQRGVVGKGIKRFPVTAISNIHVKPAGWMVSGYMQITAGGSNETKSRFGYQTWDAMSDENSVGFTMEEQPAFLALRDAIEEAQRNLHAPKPVIQEQAPDVLAQLEKLGSLRDAGILTEEEFAAKKAELLGRL